MFGRRGRGEALRVGGAAAGNFVRRTVRSIKGSFLGGKQKTLEEIENEPTYV